MTTRTPIIDSQVHSYERNRPERPWAGSLDGPAEITGDQMVEAMDAVGVDGALLVSPYSLYGFDPSYALEVYAKHPTVTASSSPSTPTPSPSPTSSPSGPAPPASPAAASCSTAGPMRPATPASTASSTPPLGPACPST